MHRGTSYPQVPRREEKPKRWRVFYNLKPAKENWQEDLRVWKHKTGIILRIILALLSPSPAKPSRLTASSLGNRGKYLPPS